MSKTTSKPAHDPAASDYDTIASELRAAIDMSGLSVTAYTRSAGVDSPTANGFLNRKRPGMTEATLVKLARIAPQGSAFRARYAAQVEALPVPDAAPTAALANATGIIAVPFGKLIPNPDNYRKTFDPEAIAELAQSIRDKGVLQNLVTFPPVDGIYKINSGGRRYAALASLHAAGVISDDYPVPCLVRDMDAAEARALAIVENIQRQDVPVLEEAQGFRALADLGWETTRIAATCGLSLRTVQDRLQLLSRLHTPAQAALAARQITLDQARAIMSVPNEDDQASLLEQAAKRDYSAAALREQAKHGKAPIEAAAFDLADYTGEFLGEGKKRLFADMEQFTALQMKAAMAMADMLRTRMTEEPTPRPLYAAVTVLPKGEHFQSWNHTRTDDPALAQAFIYIGWDHKLTVESGWMPDDFDDEDDEDDEAGLAEANAAWIKANEAAQRERVRRVQMTNEFLESLRRHFISHPVDVLRVTILECLSNEFLFLGSGVEWAHGEPQYREAVATALGLPSLFSGSGEESDDYRLPDNLPDLLEIWKRLQIMSQGEVLSLMALIMASGVSFQPTYKPGPIESEILAATGISVPDFMMPQLGDLPDDPETDDQDEPIGADLDDTPDVAMAS